MTSTFKRLFGLDVIRALAILLVMVSHTTFLFEDQEGVIIEFIRLLGATGVDIFFVLSGYLVGGLILKQFSCNFSFNGLLNFWKRRWLRTIPNYLVILIINLLLYWFIEGIVPMRFWEYFLFIQNFASPHPDFFSEAWSLSIEECAYLILPFILFLVSAGKRHFKSSIFLSVTTLVILLLLLPKVGYVINHNPVTCFDWSSSFRKVVIYRLDTIYIGFLLIYFKDSLLKMTLNYRVGLLIVSGLVFGLLNFAVVNQNLSPLAHDYFFAFIYLNVTTLCICGIFPLMIGISASTSVLLNSLVTYISKRSYALYLVNYSIVLLSIQKIFSISSWTIPLYWIASFVLSEVLYVTVERKFLNYRDRVCPRIME